MQIGVPKEIKELEFRVGLTPHACKEIVDAGHSVTVESGLGSAIGFSDEAYKLAGAKVVLTPDEVWQAELVVKVKEPQECEWKFFRKDLTLFCFLHLAAEKRLTEALIRSGITAIAFETVEDAEGKLPLLMPMSAIAGRLSVQMGARALEMPSGGKGLLLGPAAGVSPGRVLIIGGGVSGTEAAKVAIGMGADVTLIESREERLQQLNKQFNGTVRLLSSSEATIQKEISTADLLVGAVLIAGKRAPRLITRSMIKTVGKGSAFVDISIDQGGLSETSRPTTLKAPFYIEEGVVHSCVTNMPGAVSKTASEALGLATLPYVLEIARAGWSRALQKGLNIKEGKIVSEAVASSLDSPSCSQDSYSNPCDCS